MESSSRGSVASRTRSKFNLSANDKEDRMDTLGPAASPRSCAPSEPSHRSRISGTFSKASYNSSLQKKMVTLEKERKLAELEEAEELITSEREMLKIDIEELKAHIFENQGKIQEAAEIQSAEECNQLKEENNRMSKELREKEKRLKKLEIEIISKLRIIKRKKELLHQEEKVGLEQIDDLNDQYLSSDDEVEPGSSGNKAKDNTALEEEVEAEANFQKKYLELQVRLNQQKEIAEAALNKAKEKQEIAKKKQEEIDVVAAEALQEQLKLEEELKTLQGHKNPSPPENKQAPSKNSKVDPLNSTKKEEKESGELSGMGQLAKLLSEAIDHRNNSAVVTNPTQTNHFLARQSYGKDLPKFDGNPETWPTFYATFLRTTENCGFNNSDNITRLEKCLVGDARRFVNSLLVSPDNVPAIMETLKVRFGQPEAIIEAMINKVKQMPKFEESQLEQFIEFGSAVQNTKATIESLKRPEHLSNPLLLKELENKLPIQFLLQWLERSTKDDSRNLIKFNEWLQERTKIACIACPPKLSFEDTKQVNVKREPKEPERKRVQFNAGKVQRNEDFPTAAGLFVSPKDGKERIMCVFCNKHRDSSTCSQISKFPLEEKMKILQDNKICTICLKGSHWEKNCKIFVSCCICGKKHLSAMCPNNPAHHRKLDPPSTSASQESKPPTPDHTVVKTNVVSSTSTILQTLLVNMRGPNNKRGRPVRVLIDTASERSYILKSLAQEMGLKSVGKEHIMHAVFGGFHTEVKPHQRYEVTLDSVCKEFLHTFEALDAETIIGKLQRLAPGKWQKELHKQRIYLSDLGKVPTLVEVLIGADAIGNLYTGEIYELMCGLTAMQTTLGWTITGKLPDQTISQNTVVHSLAVVDQPIQNFWELEAIGIRDPSEQITRKENEALTKEHFLKTVKRDPDGRYVVNLPWIDGRPTIPDNRHIAERRLQSTTKRLMVQGQFQNYDNLLKSWEDEGFIKEVPVGNTNTPCHYIPHHGVLKPDSLTTPLRPVFDASCKAPRTPSLNECMEKGPNQSELLLSILLRFREKRIGIISDIRKAFQMIRIADEDQDYLRFLWWENNDQKVIKVYKHQRVVFGVINSPFLLSAVLEKHLSNQDLIDPEASQKLIKSIYVDNCVSSEDTEEQVLEFKNVSTEALKDAKMDLRCWESGYAEGSGIGSLLSTECGLDIGRPNPTENNSKSVTSVLGYKWDKVEDKIFCDLKADKLPDIVTKRTILSFLQKVFDPIGFTCPVTLIPKMLMQSLWKEKISWDKQLDNDIAKEFMTWCAELEELTKIRIPRHLSRGITPIKNGQIHAFSDGSKKAYSGVVFLRTEDGNGEVSVQLLLAKARVAPLKKITINRLELMGCFIAAALTASVKEALSLEDIPTIYWSDSSTALSWIKGNDLWGTFVGNRVKAICSLSNPEDWRYVPGALNPADLPSRGCSPSQLLKSQWYLGPAWLKQGPEDWPSGEMRRNEDDIMAEKKTSKVLTTKIARNIENPWYGKGSSFHGNVRKMAWILRFLEICKRKLIENKDPRAKLNRHKVSQKLYQEVKVRLQIIGLNRRIERFERLINLYRVELTKTNIKKVTKHRYQDQLKKFEKLVQHDKEEKAGIAFKGILAINIKSLSVEELKEAENKVLRLLQKDTLPLDQMNIEGLWTCRMEKDDGLIHVKTKLTNRDDLEGFKYPILLPNSHPIVEQIIREKHHQMNHALAQCLMGQLREKFWILKGRKAVRKVLDRCITCRRYTAKNIDTSPTALPEDRVKDAKPFQITGVDLAGPLFTKDKGKSWIVLFTCAIYRCVHLELVDSLSTEAFLEAFTCYTSRRGRPVTVYSDNGTNFVGMDNFMKKLDWAKIEQDVGVHQIRWKFNPPAAPWWGGWWERLVRSVKDLLRRTLKKTKLHSRGLRVLLCEIEATINSRPLTFVTEDQDDFRPLTPAMFLHELQYPGESDQDLICAQGFQKRFETRMTLIKELKMRFRREYLALLVHRGKKEKTHRELEIGEVVLIGMDNKKRWEWPMGRILEVIPGKDGKVRVVHVRTASGVLKRPVQHIYPMEVLSRQEFFDEGPQTEKIDLIQVEREVFENPEKSEVLTRVGRKVKAPERLGF